MLVGELNPCNRNGARPILPYPRGCSPRCFTELKPLRPVVLMPLPCRPRRDKWQRNGLRFSGQRTLPRDGTFISVAKAPPRRCLYRKLDSDADALVPMVWGEPPSADTRRLPYVGDHAGGWGVRSPALARRMEQGSAMGVFQARLSAIASRGWRLGCAERSETRVGYLGIEFPSTLECASSRGINEGRK
jgi:hypothetical protein